MMGTEREGTERGQRGDREGKERGQEGGERTERGQREATERGGGTNVPAAPPHGAGRDDDLEAHLHRWNRNPDPPDSQFRQMQC